MVDTLLENMKDIHRKRYKEDKELKTLKRGGMAKKKRVKAFCNETWRR